MAKDGEFERRSSKIYEDLSSQISLIRLNFGRYWRDTIDETLALGTINLTEDQEETLREEAQNLRELGEEIRESENLLVPKHRSKLWDKYDKAWNDGWFSYAALQKNLWEEAKSYAETLYGGAREAVIIADDKNKKELIKASNVFKESQGKALALRMKQEDKDRIAELFQELWEKLQLKFANNERHRNENLREARKLFDEARSAIEGIGGQHSPREALEVFKESQRDALKFSLNPEDWERLKADFDDLYRTYQDRKGKFYEEKRKKHKEWRERQEDGLHRLTKARDKILANIEANEERLETAATEEFADKVRGWIQEDEERIAEIDGKIEDAQSKLDNDPWKN